MSRVFFPDEAADRADNGTLFSKQSGDFFVTASPGAPEALRLPGQERPCTFFSGCLTPGMVSIGLQDTPGASTENGVCCPGVLS